jgi:transcriptional regulator with PAS, ATPase and Fis domain
MTSLRFASSAEHFNEEYAYNLERVLIGQHSTMVGLRRLIERIARTDATVLIRGESGTGKELVARALHRLSTRSAGAWVPVNCAAIPDNLLESEMFGHERGAFTGAMQNRKGLFAVANGGTLFLDEISEMPLFLQAKLLRVLDDRNVRPVGSDHSFEVDVRVIAASNVDLEGAVKRGKFRADLYYRLQVVPVTIVPLQERRSDIPLLIGHFLQKARDRTGSDATLSPDIFKALCSYDWPGNVRELESTIQRLLIIGADGVYDTVEEIRLRWAFLARESVSPQGLTDAGSDLSAIVRELESKLVNDALRRTAGNKQAAAKLLGLKRTTFTAKLRRYACVHSSSNDTGTSQS